MQASNLVAFAPGGHQVRIQIWRVCKDGHCRHFQLLVTLSVVFWFLWFRLEGTRPKCGSCKATFGGAGICNSQTLDTKANTKTNTQTKLQQDQTRGTLGMATFAVEFPKPFGFHIYFTLINHEVLYISIWFYDILYRFFGKTTA